MSLAVWLGEDRKCSAAVVGLDLLLGLSIVRRCSLNRSFNRRFVSPMYCIFFKPSLTHLCTAKYRQIYHIACLLKYLSKYLQ